MKGQRLICGAQSGVTSNYGPGTYEYLPFELTGSYNAGRFSGDAAAAVGLCKEDSTSCNHEKSVTFWWEEDSTMVDEISSLFEENFIDLKVVGNSQKIYPHFFARDKLNNRDLGPLYREKYFEGSNGGSYGNVVNLYFDNINYLNTAVLGAAYTKDNLSLVLVDELQGRLSPLPEEIEYRLREFRHVVPHELMHHYRASAPLEYWNPSTKAAEGEHCDQKNLGYDPADGGEAQNCLMTSPDPENGYPYPGDRFSNHLCVFCLLGDRPAVDPVASDVSVRRRDGLHVDSQPGWSGQ